jgi:hypothetical protein
MILEEVGKNVVTMSCADGGARLLQNAFNVPCKVQQ